MNPTARMLPHLQTKVQAVLLLDEPYPQSGWFVSVTTAYQHTHLQCWRLPDQASKCNISTHSCVVAAEMAPRVTADELPNVLAGVNG